MARQYTEEEREIITKRIEQILRVDWTIREACAFAWISTSLYWVWKNNDAWFADRILTAKELPIILAKRAVLAAISWWDVKASQWFLERRDSKRYWNKVTSEVKVMTEIDPLRQKLENIGKMRYVPMELVETSIEDINEVDEDAIKKAKEMEDTVNEYVEIIDHLKDKWKIDEV